MEAAAPASPSAGTRKRKKKYPLLLAIALVIVAALVLPPLVNLSRYQHRIAASISRSLGRPVEMSSVKLRLLPAPGLEISNFVVDEDPAFGAEPMLRAPSMVAYLRLASLWRGRFEVSRISLDSPSLNLTRDAQGRWNIGTVLLRASHISNAPTAQRHAGAAPRFPYIEASDGRINFKQGEEKKPFSLLNADFSMWLANPGEWRLRVEAQPVRTDLDLDLAETGTLKINGSLRRASTVNQMPVDLHADWSSAPLGQISRLLLGRNTDWRGSLHLHADINGTPQSLRLKAALHIDSIHRQEFTPSEPVTIDAACQGDYLHGSRSLDNVACSWPVNAGQFLLAGSIQDLGNPQPDFTLRMDKVPASLALTALRMVRPGAAPDVNVKGLIDGQFTYKAAASQPFSGEAAVHGFELNAPGLDAPLTIPRMHFATAAAVRRKPQRPGGKQKSRRAPVVAASLAAAPATILLESFPLAIGTSPGPRTALIVDGQFTTAGFALHLGGQAQVKDLRAFSADFGWLHRLTAGLGPQGTSGLNVTIHGPWVPSLAQPPFGVPVAPSSVTTEGTLHLRNAVYQPGFLAGPVEIVSAQASLSPSQDVWNPVTAVYQQLPVQLSVSLSLACEAAAGCPAHFNADLDSLNAGALASALMGAGEHGELLDQIMARFASHSAQWPTLTGTVHAGTFTLGPLALHDATADLSIAGRRLRIAAFDGQALGGMLHAAGSVDAASGAPVYDLELQLARADATEVSALFKEKWGAGILSANAKLAMTGYSAAQLASSAQGAFHIDWNKGALSVGKPSPLAHFDRWSADGAVSGRKISLQHSVLVNGGKSIPVTGSIGFDRRLDLTVGTQETVTGTLRHPVVGTPQR